MYLFLGKTKVDCDGYNCDYNGEVDENGEACGFGIATLEDEPTWSHEGTFLNSKAHGICKYTVYISA